MGKLYTQKNIPIVSPQVTVEAGNIIAEEVKKLPAGYHVPKIHSPLENKFNRSIKRTIDITISLVVIMCVLSWLIPLLAIFIKLDSKGPIFFLQKRNGNQGNFFTCIKLRTMFVNKEANMLAATDNDGRITRFGLFLRNRYLDELPQFINVLLGEMSIIGPRPHMLSDNSRYATQVNNYSIRQQVKPGITGLAQVLGYSGPINNLHKIRSRVKMDIFYIRHWSPKLDRVIFYRTICKILGI